MFAVRVNFAFLLLLPQAVAASSASSSARLAIITPDAGAAPPLQERESAALLQADAELRPPNGPGWFGGFSEGESTYSDDGRMGHRNTNPEVNVMDGWNPHQENPLTRHAKVSDWFQESKSGADKQALQSFEPAERFSVAGNRVHTGAWYKGTGGAWQETYLATSALAPQKVPAGWFDDSVNQLDGFGRRKLPGLDSARNFLDWEERSVNTTLSCKDAGCTANVSLLAPFDFTTEMYKNCKLSVHFHPTDFDDQLSDEYVEWVEVNNHRIASKCRPKSDGCNQSAARPLLPCVSDVPLDLLMPVTGQLFVSAKIPTSVDECPYKGNMLSAVPMVTCLVSIKHNENAPAPKKVTALVSEESCVTKMPLQCAKSGCAAEIAIPINASCSGLGGCTLDVDVAQTDFDGADGTVELIEYIKVDRQAVKSNLKPGKNPCKSKWGGSPIAATEMNFTALKDHPVSITNGTVLVEGKISTHVDECASEGYLFNAVATVTCKGKAGKKAALLSESRRQLRGRGF